MPFAAATVLTILVSFGKGLRLTSEQIAGSVFPFFAPWAWLLDRDWFGEVHSRLFESLISFAFVLWIPAALYAACLWLVIWLLGFLARRFARWITVFDRQPN